MNAAAIRGIWSEQKNFRVSPESFGCELPCNTALLAVAKNT